MPTLMVKLDFLAKGGRRCGGNARSGAPCRVMERGHMWKVSLIFLLFVAITPQSQTFMIKVYNQSSQEMAQWAPFSYIVLVTLVAALFGSIVLVKTWPERVEPESPMAKYRHEAPFED